MSKIQTPYLSKITGTGAAFPARRLTNQDLSKTVETNDEWIRERTGILERRIVKPGDPSEFNSALGYRASLQALEMAGKTPQDIDTILYATCTPDTVVPSTACWLQHKLGAKRAFAVDLNAACSGFVYALSVADQFIRTGQIQTALVVGADLLSTMTNWQDRSTCILFGDAAGALVVERTTPESPSHIIASHLHADGDLWDYFHVEAGGSRMETTPLNYEKQLHKMQMKGREMFKVAVRTLADYAVEALESQGYQLSDLDWLVPHQANLRIIEAVAKRLGVPMSKVIVNIDRFGNTSSATVPTALDEAVRDGRIKRGQLVLFDVFGAGLTYGTTLIRW